MKYRLRENETNLTESQLTFIIQTFVPSVRQSSAHRDVLSKAGLTGRAVQSNQSFTWLEVQGRVRQQAISQRGQTKQARGRQVEPGTGWQETEQRLDLCVDPPTV